MSIRVIVVDDSAMMRAIIEARLSDDPDIEVVAVASNAQEARVLIKQYDPDVITLDIEMPGMDGLSFLEKIMELRPTPVIIVSGSTQAGTQTTARALQLGAVSCYSKTDRHGGFATDDSGKLARLVHEAAAVNMNTLMPGRTNPHVAEAAQNPRSDVIAIGSSTGGVEALHAILPGFEADCPPTLVVQHVNACFAPAIAQSLDSASRARVKIAQSDMPLEPGTIYLAPGGDRHMQIAPAGSHGKRIILRSGDPVSGHLPSIDVLFGSVAAVCGKRATGVLLTGMGQDGANGLLKLAQAGSATIAQNEASCVVFGMPRKAIEMGAAKRVMDLSEIAPALFARQGALI